MQRYLFHTYNERDTDAAEGRTGLLLSSHSVNALQVATSAYAECHNA